eukprot:SAG31_NODE_16285_length_715_cov_0.917208_1_plen_143_part_01
MSGSPPVASEVSIVSHRMIVIDEERTSTPAASEGASGTTHQIVKLVKQTLDRLELLVKIELQPELDPVVCSQAGGVRDPFPTEATATEKCDYAGKAGAMGHGAGNAETMAAFVAASNSLPRLEEAVASVVKICFGGTLGTRPM